jgi:hypothetical protein
MAWFALEIPKDGPSCIIWVFEMTYIPTSETNLKAFEWAALDVFIVGFFTAIHKETGQLYVLAHGAQTALSIIAMKSVSHLLSLLMIRMEPFHLCHRSHWSYHSVLNQQHFLLTPTMECSSWDPAKALLHVSRRDQDISLVYGGTFMIAKESDHYNIIQDPINLQGARKSLRRVVTGRTRF